jgi:DNA-binding IclR family transcriptional regulator
MKPIDKFTQVLKIILNSPGISQKLIVRTSGLDASTACRILKDAARLGYAERTRDKYYPGKIFQDYLSKSISIE